MQAPLQAFALPGAQPLLLLATQHGQTGGMCPVLPSERGLRLLRPIAEVRVPPSSPLPPQQGQ